MSTAPTTTAKDTSTGRRSTSRPVSCRSTTSGAVAMTGYLLSVPAAGTTSIY